MAKSIGQNSAENNAGQKGEIVIYKEKSGKMRLKVKVEENTVWLAQKQMAELFNVERSVVTKHISNVLKSGELKKNSVCAIFAQTARDGKVYRTRFYNLDMIISVGYRVNSIRGVQFRIWATNVLRGHIIKGYTVNQKRLKQQSKIRLAELQRTVRLLQDVIEKKTLETDEMKGLLKVITDYANTWALLEQYDKQSLKVDGGEVDKGKLRPANLFSYSEAKSYIENLKQSLIKKKEAGKFFGIERDEGLAGILGNINQVIADKPVYVTIEEKAAHLLYFVIKDRVFIDGNKRIAALLFIMFLSRNNRLFNKKGEKIINDNALVALSLLVAESNLRDKDIMIALITNLLAG